VAVELSEDEGFDGKDPRRYDHELESFSWVGRCVLAGRESERPCVLDDWLGNNLAICGAKLRFITQGPKIPIISVTKVGAKS